MRCERQHSTGKTGDYSPKKNIEGKKMDSLKNDIKEKITSCKPPENVKKATVNFKTTAPI